MKIGKARGWIWLRVEHAPWSRRRDRMIAGLLGVVDGLVALVTFGYGESDLVMSYLMWRAERDGMPKDRPPSVI